jgi:hypothetical protein
MELKNMNIIYNEQKSKVFVTRRILRMKYPWMVVKNKKTKTFLQIFKWDNSTFESSTYYPITNIQLCIYSPVVTFDVV